MKKRVASCLLSLLLCSAAWCLTGCQESGKLVISEIVSGNRNSYTDAILGTPDWIELHNTGNTAVRLQGFILTDKTDDLGVGRMLPDVTVPAGGYYLLPADGMQADNADVFCLPFGISRSGETLYLLNASQMLIDEVVVPALSEDVSYARRDDGSFGYSMQPTPGAANTQDIFDALPEAAGAAFEPSDINLIINEAVSSATDGSDWIELYNPTDADLDTTGCFLTDDESNPRKAAVPAVTVPAHGYAVIACDKNRGDAAGVSISSDGENLYLLDAYARSIDAVAIPALGRGQSWAYREDTGFGYCGLPTPGAENTAPIGADAYVDMDENEPLRISEALFDNKYSCIDAYGMRSDWIELHNSGSGALSLSGYYLSDDSTQPMKWAFPDDAVIGADEYLVVFLSEDASINGELHTGFAVSVRDDGCSLYCAETRAIDRMPYVEEQKPNVSVGRNAKGEPVYYAYPTPGEPNAQAFSGVEELSAALTRGVYISEVSAGGSGGDWVEIGNGSDRDVDPSGWYLTDNAQEPLRFCISGITVPAGGFAVIEASSDAANTQTAPFGISPAGETILLSDPDGFARDVMNIGVIESGQTAGRTGTGATRVCFFTPTKGKENSAAYAVYHTAEPVFSDTALYHTDALTLSLSCRNASAVIRYTLNGSVPGESSALYTSPIIVSGNTTVRARAYADGCTPSAVSTAHYLFDAPHSLPVVCIAVEPENWEDILGAELGSVPDECAASLSFYEPNGMLGTVFPAGIRARGNMSLKYPQKSLAVHLRADYGQKTVTYPFWGAGSSAAYATLVLRNGSQDIASARLRDSFANRAAANMNLDTVMTRPVAVYANSSYFGILDLNEGMNQDYLETRFGVDPDTVNIIGKDIVVRHGKIKDLSRVNGYARNEDFSDNATVGEFSNWVDIEHVNDYLIAQTFFGNYDMHNQNWWSTDDYAIRWRPYLYDTDRCFCEGRESNNLFLAYFNPKGVVYNPQGRKVRMDVYCALQQNDAWCQQFVARYAELLCTELSVARLTTLLDEMAAVLRPEMPLHIARWGRPASMEAWEESITNMRKQIELRHAAIQELICDEFHLSKTEWDALIQRYGG